MENIDFNHLINRFSFWVLVFAIILFTMSPFVYALSISFRTNPQVLIEARYLPETTNFERQYNLDKVQIIDVVNPGELEEYIELQNIGPRTISLEGWRITSSESYELRTLSLQLDPTENESYTGQFAGFDESQSLSLTTTRATNDVVVIFGNAQRNFDPEAMTNPSQLPRHTATIERLIDIGRWDTINDLVFEFEVKVDYFTRYEFPELRVDSGEILRIYTGEGADSDTELYMNLPFVSETTPAQPFSGRLWGNPDTTITLTNERSIQEATYVTGTDRTERIQFVDQAALGDIRYESFANFFDSQVLSGQRLIAFLEQFGGTTEPADGLFSSLGDTSDIEDAFVVYGEADPNFDVAAATALVDALSDALTAEAFTAAMIEAGFPPDFIEPIVEEGSRLEGERIIIQHFGQDPVNLEGWRITNTQNQRTQFTLPSFILQPDTQIAVATGYGLNTPDGLFLNHERSYWEEEQVSNLTDANGLRRSSYIIGGEVYALRNYSNLLEDDTFLQNLWNSALVATVSVTLSLVVGSFAAYALGRVRFRGQSIILYLVLAMTMFPQISILSGMFEIVNNLDIYNSNLAMIFSYPLFTLPFTVWVLTSFFQGLPSEIEQAALVDGATAFQTFWRILVPLTAPALVTTGLLAFIAAWNEYLFALTFTLGEDNRTVPVAIAQFSGFDREDPTADKIAAAVVVTIPLLVLVLVFQRRIVEGLTAGAVKG